MNHRLLPACYFILLALYAMNTVLAYNFFVEQIAAKGAPYWAAYAFHVIWGLLA